MHHSRFSGLIIDCRTDSLEEATRFWSQALGRKPNPPPPGDELYLGLEDREGQPPIEVQKVDHPSRVHLDIVTDDVEAEVKRLERLGARRVGLVRDWWVLEAPTGHRFCVLPARKPLGPANRWD